MIAGLAAAMFAICPEAALNCVTLVPTAPVRSASGTIAILSMPSPFGIAVTVDGRPRQHLVATVTGLPAPQSLGAYTTYIAWGYTLALDSAVKLGPVRNGRVDLGELDHIQFRILITAEASPAVTRRGGLLVLRGTSPSARLLAHRDLLQPSAPGAWLGSAASLPHHETGATRAAVWPMPPMPPGMPAMPGMAGLVPTTAPFLPSLAASPARATTTIRLSTGDTLLLESGTISRTVAGKTFALYGFNAQSPGPLIEVRQGATIVVRYHNALGVPSSVHWHGVRLDNASDGAVGLTQEAVAPGGSFTYTIRFPDAGIYWYHPHVREDIQQALGLFGNLLVRPPTAAYYNPVDREAVLTLDDVLMADDGPAPFGSDAPTHALMGRFGNLFLVNGEPRYQLDVKRGDVVRFYLTNVSSARTYNLSFGGARMKVVASDGGKFEREEWVQSLVIGPAERYVVEVEFARAGATALVNRVQALDHFIGSYHPEVDTLGVVQVGAGPAAGRNAASFRALRQYADVAASLGPFRKYFARPVDHELVLTLRTRNLPPSVTSMLLGVNAAMDWNDGMPMMNWLSTGNEVSWILRDPATGRENMEIDWRFRRGDVVKLRLFNDPASSHAMQHPMHLHGQRFLVLSRDGSKNTNLVWKDTVIIPAGETVELLVEMSNPGKWMLHCHIAEHLSAGMMAAFTIE